MSEKEVNSDLLKCENQYYRQNNETKSLLITKKALKGAINCPQNPIKTERISSNVLSRAKDFLEKSKEEPIGGQSCDLVDNEDTNECSNDGKPEVEMNFILFANKDQSDSEEETSDSSDSSSDDADDEDTSDCEQQSNDNESNCVTK